jgi:hypothetical protein
MILCGTAALAALLAPAGPLAAQSIAKPAVVISVAKADKLLADVGYLTRAAGAPEFGGLVTLMAGPYLQGIDSRRPAGVHLQFAGPQPTGLAFLPVADVNVIIKQLEDSSIEVEDAGGGVKRVQLQRPVFFKQNGGWVFVSDAQQNLANLPQDPSVSLGGLHEQYDLAVQVNVRNVDPMLIDMAVSEMKAGFDRTIEAEEDQDKRQLQERIGRQSLESFVRLLRESDQLTIGWGVDGQKGSTFIDFGYTAVAGTKLAQQLAAYQNLSSSFAGFELPGAAATLRVTAPVDKEEVDQIREALKAMRDQASKAIDEDEDLPSAEARRAAKQIMGALIDVLIATLEGGKLDGGAAVLLAPGSINLVAGGLVADGMAVQSQVKKLVALAQQSGKNDAKIEDVRFNVGKHKDVDLHTFSVPVSNDDERARRVFGEKLSVALGTGAKSVYLAFGPGSLDLVKRVMDSSGAPRPVSPFELNVSLSPIMAFAAAAENDPIVKALAESIKQSNGKDRVRITQKSVERGVSARLEVEEGVLQMIGAAAKARNNAGN